ncbi:DUF4261 domain-containing protein [Occultella gossypii]|uniref:DUF4261 domain-containing protein n=1 Tax=Occultella gossypii TaxID=2800820 RepID=A0ABS7S883_9MICO|nr:DUF4261 domain-containing protein [Occultella gossypii]MBZ2196562.1 DUF4261 domain-containing protein [Occultella gossypii]
MAAQLAFLMQDAPDDSITEESLSRQLLTDWPDLDPALLSTDDSASRTAHAGEPAPILLHYGGTMIAVMSVRSPIGDDLADIAQHSRLWPNDAPVPVDYTAHSIVSVFAAEATGHRAATDQAVLLSKVIASLIGLSGGIRAVYWGSAEHVILPVLFRDLALNTLPTPLLLAWVAMNVGTRPDGVLTGHTLGLDQLGVMDIEIPNSPEDASGLLDRLVGIADYQLQNGPVIGNADTIGSVAEAQIIAHHAPSAIGDERTVLSLSFVSNQSPARKKGLFRRR